MDIEGLSIYVLDSHRPIHKKNIKSKSVFILTNEVIDEDENLEEKIEDTPKTSDDAEEGEADEEKGEEEGDDEEIKDNEKEKEENRITSTYGSCISMLLYDLASRLNKVTNELLWLGIIGFTDQIVHNKIDSGRWKVEMKAWRDEVYRLNGITIDYSQKSGTFIQCGDEYRFMAYRHWNLYDSMYHSSFIAARLSIWKSSNSRNGLKKMLAKMGLPLEQCLQPYTSMNMKVKSELPKKLKLYADQFNLHDITFESFVKSSGFTKHLSAADAVYSLSGLLEARTSSFSAENSENLQTTGDPNADGENSWKENFTTAYASLSNSSSAWELVMTGIKHAIELQKEIVKQGGSLIENKHISLVGSFRYAWLNTTTCPSYSLPLFCNSLALTKLALFLQQVFEQMKKPVKPIIIGALNEEKDVYLIVAVSTSPNSNKFGYIFEKAAIDTGAKIALHTFDSSIVEIARSDAKIFIEHLHYGLSV